LPVIAKSAALERSMSEMTCRSTPSAIWGCCETQQDLLLSFELLQQVRLEFRATGDFQDFKQRHQGRVVRARIFLGYKVIGTLEQVFQTQQVRIRSLSGYS